MTFSYDTCMKPDFPPIYQNGSLLTDVLLSSKVYRKSYSMYISLLSKFLFGSNDGSPMSIWPRVLAFQKLLNTSALRNYYNEENSWYTKNDFNLAFTNSCVTHGQNKNVTSSGIFRFINERRRFLLEAVENHTFYLSFVDPLVLSTMNISHQTRGIFLYFQVLALDSKFATRYASLNASLVFRQSYAYSVHLPWNFTEAWCISDSCETEHSGKKNLPLSASYVVPLSFCEPSCSNIGFNLQFYLKATVDDEVITLPYGAPQEYYTLYHPSESE